MCISIRWIAWALPLVAACSAPVFTPPATPAPDLGKRLVARHAVVSAAHPRASEAGEEILRRGGNAVDAAVATAFTVSVGEPQMSGMGGGGGMLIWLQDQQRTEYIDFYPATRPASFRGVAPADSTTRSDLRVVGIPGYVAGLLEAHQRFGKLSRREVLAPAIRLAEEGFPVNQILAQMIAQDSAKLVRYPESRRILFPKGRALRPGDLLRNPELAATLRKVAEQGREGFYQGEVARAFVRELNQGGHPATIADLTAYTPQWKRPLCGEYRGWTVLSAPPPQTGMQILQTLNLLEGYDLPALGLPTQSARAFDVLTSALRVGLADSRHISDPNWTTVPATGVISDGFAGQRRRAVGTGKVVEKVEPGDPAAFEQTPLNPACQRYEPYGSARATHAVESTSLAPGVDSSPRGGETTHLSVVDPQGNAVALTQTNSSTFGVGNWVAGFFLNDSGIDFSRPSSASQAQLRGRHPYMIRKSTISPTIVLKNGRVAMVVGAPGGGRIPTEIVQNMVYVLDYGLDPLDALRMPRIFPSANGRQVQLENGFDAQLLGQVRAMGYEPTSESFGYARLYMIARREGRWIGVADPRHNGAVRGY
ncbi:MAG: gamma-glutamyltransferase family protein [Gemmatimonadota bacterium]|nr:gamma-glutamyltransferase family protein [Gemmatimonadota bacterium]